MAVLLRVKLTVANAYYDDCFFFHGGAAPKVGDVITVEAERQYGGEPPERYRAKVTQVTPGGEAPVVAVELRRRPAPSASAVP